MGTLLALTNTQQLVIAVCILGIVIIFCTLVLTWDHPGKASTDEKRSHRRLMEEIRRHGEPRERR